MYRNIIFDFLSNYRTLLNDNKCSELAIVLFSNAELDLTDICGQKEEIAVYHVKEPYIFSKKYDFSKTMGTIIEEAFKVDDSFKLELDKLANDLKDPYYFRNLKEFNVKSIYTIPFYHNYNKSSKSIAGIIIFYSNLDHPCLNISNQRLLTLKNKLHNDEINDIKEYINQTILLNDQYHVVIKAKKADIFYCNDLFKTSHHFISNYIEKGKNSTIYQMIKKYVSSMHKVEESDYVIYYNAVRNASKMDTPLEYLSLETINNHQFEPKLALIYLRSIDEIEEAEVLTQKLSKIAVGTFPEAIYKFYKVDKYTVCQLVNQELTKANKADINYQLKKRYHQVINIPSELAMGVNLNGVVDYLHQVLPDEFSYKEYSLYLNKINIGKLSCDLDFPRKSKILIAASSQKEIGQIIIEPIINFYDIASYKIFEQSVIEKMEASIHKTMNNPVYSILLSTVAKRKMQEVLKKIINKFPTSKLILHLPVNVQMNYEKVYELVNRLKKMGFILIADSSIFMNLEHSTSMKEIDAILIRKNECGKSLSRNNPFNVALLNAYYDEGKVVVFESIPEEEDAELINELTCLIVER